MARNAMKMIRTLHRWRLCCIEPVTRPANCSLQAQLKLPSRQFHHAPYWSQCEHPITACSTSYHHIIPYHLNLLWYPIHTSERHHTLQTWVKHESWATAKMTMHAMHPIYGCPENFQESLSTPTATFAEIFNGLLFWLILWMCIQNLNFVALPITEIIGGTPNIWAVPGYAHAPFSPKFVMGICSDGPCECTCQI